MKKQSLKNLFLLVSLCIFTGACLRQGATSTDSTLAHQEQPSPADSTCILKGIVRIGHEVSSFTPEGCEESYWIIDTTGNLRTVYHQATHDALDYPPLLMEMELEYKGVSDDGFAADYAGVYSVRRIISVEAGSDTGNMEEMENEIIHAEFVNEKGEKLSATFFNMEGKARIEYKGETYELTQYRTASGYGYKNETVDMRGKGQDMDLTFLKENTSVHFTEKR